MARFVKVGGETTGVPGVRQNSLRPEAGGTPGLLPSGNVAILGECRGTIQPGIVHRYKRGTRFKTELGSGTLYDASRFALSPTRDLPESGVGQIKATELFNIRVNPATQSTGDLDGDSAAVVTLTSRGYGIDQNMLTRKVQAGTSGGPGKKLTLSYPGKDDEVGDDLGFEPVFLIRYTTGACTLTINGTQLTTSAGLSLSFADYPTLDVLISAIRAVAGYEVIAPIRQPEKFRCADLDYITAVSINLVDSGSVSLGDATTTSMTLASIVAGNVVRLNNSEYVYVSAAGSPNTIERGYMDSTATAHSSVDADEFYPVTQTAKATIDWANSRSTLVTAARASTTNVGHVATAATATYFSGGGEGTTTTTKWQDALKELRKYRVNFIVVCTSDPIVHNYLKTHLAWRWGLGGSEAVGHIGLAKGLTKAQIKVQLRNIDDPNIVAWFQDCNRDDDQGVDTNYDPWALAVMGASIQAGSPFGTPLSEKTFNVSSISQDPGIDLIDNADFFIEHGGAFARYKDNAWRCVRALTTWSRDDTDFRIEPNLRHSVAWTLFKVRDRIRFYHLGKPAESGNAAAIRGTMESVLEEIRDTDKAIVEGSRIVNGTKEVIPAFDDIEVDQTGNVADAGYKFVPIGGTDFVNVDSVVGTFQDVA